METSYFTFGQDHLHRLNGITLDKDIVLQVIHEDPREWMFENFGPEWSMEYAPKYIDKEFRSHFPRGIINYETRERV